MVVFTCEACNESLKKNKVEAHLYKCRRSRHVTCIDCQVDFDAESYKAHTSCISESEKYSGPGYVAKASTNKGAKKQDDWFQRVQAAIGSSRGLQNRQLSSVLLKVSESSNVPRKQAKFVNFCRNSMKWATPALIQQAWELIAESAQPAAKQPQVEEKQLQQKQKMEEAEQQTVEAGVGDVADEAEATRKRKRKEERRRKRLEAKEQEQEQEVPAEDNGAEEAPEESPKAAKRRRKGVRKDSGEEAVAEEATAVAVDSPQEEQEQEDKKKKRKKRRKQRESEEQESQQQELCVS